MGATLLCKLKLDVLPRYLRDTHLRTLTLEQSALLKDPFHSWWRGGGEEGAVRRGRQGVVDQGNVGRVGVPGGRPKGFLPVSPSDPDGGVEVADGLGR